MSVSDPLETLKQGIRLLYVLMFVALLSAVGQWHLPFTLWYMLGIVLSIITGLSVVTDNDAWFEYDLIRLGLEPDNYMIVE